MTEAVPAVVSVVVFLAVLAASGAVGSAQSALGTAHEALGALRDRARSDDQREAAARKASWALMATFISIVARSALAVGAALIPVWGFDAAGAVSMWATFEYMGRPSFILLSAILMTLGFLLWRRTKRSH